MGSSPGDKDDWPGWLYTVLFLALLAFALWYDHPTPHLPR